MIKEKEFEEIPSKAHSIGTRLKTIQKKSKKTARVGVRFGLIELALLNNLAQVLGISKSKLLRISLGHFSEYLDNLSQKELTKIAIAIRKYE